MPTNQEATPGADEVVISAIRRLAEELERQAARIDEALEEIDGLSGRVADVEAQLDALGEADDARR